MLHTFLSPLVRQQFLFAQLTQQLVHTSRLDVGNVGGQGTLHQFVVLHAHLDLEGKGVSFNHSSYFLICSTWPGSTVHVYFLFPFSSTYRG